MADNFIYRTPAPGFGSDQASHVKLLLFDMLDSVLWLHPKKLGLLVSHLLPKNLSSDRITYSDLQF